MPSNRYRYPPRLYGESNKRSMQLRPPHHRRQPADAHARMAEGGANIVPSVILKAIAKTLVTGKTTDCSPLMSHNRPGRFLHIYCDESRQTADRYMVIGGVIAQREDELLFTQDMRLFRQSHNMRSELKWTKVSDQKLSEYRALIDLFFSLSRAVYFKAIVVDTQEIDHRTHNKSNPELGFYKLMYQFLLHSFGGDLRQDDCCLIFLDQRTTTNYKLSTLCAILKNGLRKKYGLDLDTVRNIQATDSKQSDLIQIADVLMGAIGYEMNGAHTRTGAKRAKVLLAEYIAQKAGLLNLQQPTPRSNRHFSIWHFHFRRRRGNQSGQ